MVIKKSKVRINNDKLVVAYKNGKMLELTTVGKQDKTIKPLKEGKYIKLSTGEIKYFIKGSNNRTANLKSLKVTFKKIRRIVATNFHSGDLWLTLTYAQNNGKPMRDTTRVYKDFDLFKRKFKRKFGDFEYFRCFGTPDEWQLAFTLSFKKERWKVPFYRQ